MQRSRGVRALVLALVLALLGTTVAQAQQGATRSLRVGLIGGLTALDPHVHSYIPNETVSRHIFEPLFQLDDKGVMVPMLAERWQASGPTTWTLSLRQGVFFHDGSPFEAEDVAATLRRVRTVPTETHGYVQHLSLVTGVEVVDRHTLRLHTDGPHPTLLHHLAALVIVPRSLEHAPPETFTTGASLIGTGPFRFLRHEGARGLRLVANPHHWGGPPVWSTVSLLFLPDPAERVTALISGEVDVIEAVPPADVARLTANPRYHLVSVPSQRVIYLGLEIAADDSPFRDVRVRRAFSLAIDRRILTTEALQTLGTPANQIVPLHVFGANPGLPPLAYDPGRARALLAEAGWDQTRPLTLFCPHGRYPNDREVAASIGAMLARVGVTVTLGCLDPPTFFARASNREFTLFLAGFSALSGEAGGVLFSLLGTPKAESGRGSANRSGWSSPALDALLDQAATTLDSDRRAALLHEANALAMTGLPLIPLYVQHAAWAMGTGFTYVPRSDERTLAQFVHPTATDAGR